MNIGDQHQETCKLLTAGDQAEIRRGLARIDGIGARNRKADDLSLRRLRL